MIYFTTVDCTTNDVITATCLPQWLETSVNQCALNKAIKRLGKIHL